jgi:hypothetical protein
MPIIFPNVNTPETTINLDFPKFFICQTISKHSPIDEFYKVCSELVKLTKPDIIRDNPVVTRLLLLGYVSAVEEYLRSIFCEIINVCPVAKERVFDKMIKFGSIDFYERERLPEGLFEASALSSYDEIKKRSNDFIGINIESISSLKTALEKFDDVCHLRHCAVHGGGTLNAHNAKELRLGKEFVKRKLQPDAINLQYALGVCFSFVRAYNQNVFNFTVNNWVAKKHISGKWVEDKELFSKLLNILWSTHDNGERLRDNIIYKNIFPISIRQARAIS